MTCIRTCKDIHTHLQLYISSPAVCFPVLSSRWHCPPSTVCSHGALQHSLQVNDILHAIHRQSCFVKMQLVDETPLWFVGWDLFWIPAFVDAAVAFIKELIPALLDLSQTTSQCKQGQRDILITGNVILTASYTALYCCFWYVWPLCVCRPTYKLMHKSVYVQQIVYLKPSIPWALSALSDAPR